MPFIAPIIAGIVEIGATISTFVAAAGVIGQGIIMAGIGVAASYLISALTPKPQNASDATPGGVNFQRQYGADVPRQVACGLVGMAGHDTYVNTFGTGNQVLQQIYTLSDYYTTGLAHIYINGVDCSLGADGGPSSFGRPVTGGGTFANDPPLMWIRFFDGRQTAADLQLVGDSNPVGRWVSANVGTGISAILVTMLYDKDNNNSFPDFFFSFSGAPFYDYRKDSTVGGSGSHRWDDVTTHEYTANPIIIEYNYRRGLSVNGDFFCGMDMPASDLPLDKWIAAANLCDETQPDDLPRYQCSIILDCMKAHSDNLQSLSLSCGSMQIDGVDGSWPLVGSDQSAVATFTDADIISLADFKYTAKQSMSTLVNSVSGNFPDPDQMFAMVGYTPQIAADFVTIDRRTRDIAMDFAQVISQRQAEQLAWIYLYENRFEITATVTLRPRFQTLEVGDWVTWISARYGTNTFIVTGAQLLSLDNAGPRNAVLSLQQRDGQIYDGVTPVPIVIPFPPGDPVYMSEVASFAVLPVSVQGADGMVQAGIRASWATIDDVTVTQVDVMYYPVGDPTSIIHKIVDATVTVAILAEGIVGGTLYEVRARILTKPSRTTTFNAGLTVTTTNDLYSLANFNAGVAYQVKDLLSNFDSRIATMEQLIAAVSNNNSGRQWNNKQMVQTQLQSVTGNLSASITEVMTVATDTQSAFATLETTVTASIGDLSASVDTNTTAIADIGGSLVASWSMTLDVNGHISGLHQISDGTTSAFVISTDVFQIANPAAFGNAAQTVFTLQTVAGVTQMALRGDFIADGTVTARTIIAGGINAVDILASGSITAASGTIGHLAVKSLSIDNNAVTVPVGLSLSSSVTLTNTVQSDLGGFTMAIDTSGLSGVALNILYTMNLLVALGASDGITVQIKINGVADGIGEAVNSAGSGEQVSVVVSGIHSWTASGGTDTFVFDALGASALVSVTAVGVRTLWAMAVKR